MNSKNYFDEYLKAINKINFDEMEAFINTMLKSYLKGNIFFFIGNGGSHANASHIAGDLMGSIAGQFYCLSDNSSQITALSNDIDFNDVYSELISHNCPKNSSIIFLSGSGNSKNIIKAISVARQKSIETFGISSFSGGQMMNLCDYHFHFKVNDMEMAEDFQLQLLHIFKLRILENFPGQIKSKVKYESRIDNNEIA